MRTKKRPWLKVDLHRLARDIRDFPDAYHRERAERLGVSARGICDAMKRVFPMICRAHMAIQFAVNGVTGSLIGTPERKPMQLEQS